MAKVSEFLENVQDIRRVVMRQNVTRNLNEIERQKHNEEKEAESKETRADFD